MKIKEVSSAPVEFDLFEDEVAATWCEELIDENGVYRACHAELDPQPYYEACKHDRLQSTGTACDAFKAYETACHELQVLGLGSVLDG